MKRGRNTTDKEEEKYCGVKKVNQSHYRPGQPQRVPRRLPDFVKMAQDGGKIVSLAHLPPLPPGNTPGTHLC